jgi:hypothetical protein
VIVLARFRFCILSLLPLVLLPAAVAAETACEVIAPAKQPKAYPPPDAAPDPDIEKTVAEYNCYREALGYWAVFEDMQLRARAGVTNNDGDNDLASGVTKDLDSTTTDLGLEVGYYGRPILRDIVLRNSDGALRNYVVWKSNRRKRLNEDWQKEDWINLMLIDAVKLDLTVGYGRVIEDPQGEDNGETKTKGTYTARLRWELPLDFYAPKNPFDQ